MTIIADFRTKSRNYSVLRKANKRRPNKQVRLIAERLVYTVCRKSRRPNPVSLSLNFDNFISVVNTAYLELFWRVRVTGLQVRGYVFRLS